ncbi:MAG: RDD family protein [Planctomycetota bacterium]|nr:RDD family protein [Planctomycetota bacterium]
MLVVFTLYVALYLLVSGVVLGEPANLSSGETGSASRLTFAYLFLVSVPLLYFSVMDSSLFKGTFGKVIMRLKVTKTGSEGRIHYVRGFWRALVKMVSIIAFPLLFISLFTPHNRAVHDLLANTVVRERDVIGESLKGQNK